ncbi:MAG: hypothetical protein CM15mP46_5390 [Alphaproteobacteria bacterium]|nr:MAG: hypothetical protein CM15mP46_5390 [Alphaproteobacteria bacterium]
MRPRAQKFADMLERYEAPEIDPAVDEALRAFIARRMEELPDADYFKTLPLNGDHVNKPRQSISARLALIF